MPPKPSALAPHAAAMAAPDKPSSPLEPAGPYKLSSLAFGAS